MLPCAGLPQIVTELFAELAPGVRVSRGRPGGDQLAELWREGAALAARCGAARGRHVPPSEP